MSSPHLIGPTLSKPTPAPLGLGRRPRRTLPPDLLREASRRLGVMSLLGAALWIIGNVTCHLAWRAMNAEDPRWYRLHTFDGITLIALAVSVALFFYTRGTSRDPAFILDVGLGYMIFTALALGVGSHLEPWPTGVPIVPLISWSGVLVLLFPAIVPSTPLKTLVAGLVTVSMNPLAMLLARARGIWSFRSGSDVILMHYSDYILAGVGVVISYVVTGLGQQVARARELGSYRLGELLGRGGMGEVYKASHRMLARPAAIKLIRADMIAGDPQAARMAVMRFRREAEAAARLRSPHTVALYDFGVTEDQTLYLVMELLEGLDLQTLVREFGPVGVSRTIHILRQACASLEEAHAAGLVHRDIKPANIHVGRLGLEHDFVKVLDFGLVKWVAGENLEQTLGTAAALTPGTPAYMAPEAALGESLDGRSDLYSLGCVGYYLLTGKMVFEVDTALRMVASHLRSEPMPPSRRVPVRIPAALDRLVLACLAKRREERPQSAAELTHALGSIDVPPWTQAQAAAWWKALAERRAPEPVKQTAG